MINYTKIPNELLNNIDLSVQARYLLCVLLRHCGRKETCFPSQKALAATTRFSTRYIRKLICELKSLGYIQVRRGGFNKSNVYYIDKTMFADSDSVEDYHNNNR